MCMDGKYSFTPSLQPFHTFFTSVPSSCITYPHSLAYVDSSVNKVVLNNTEQHPVIILSKVLHTQVLLLHGGA